jgi:predicted transcriptional regulator
MTHIPTPQDVEILAVTAGISVAEACRRAKLAPDVFTRWRAGKTSPGIESVRAIVAQLEAARDARPAPEAR